MASECPKETRENSSIDFSEPIPPAPAIQEAPDSDSPSVAPWPNLQEARFHTNAALPTEAASCGE